MAAHSPQKGTPLPPLGIATEKMYIPHVYTYGAKLGDGKRPFLTHLIGSLPVGA